MLPGVPGQAYKHWEGAIVRLHAEPYLEHDDREGDLLEHLAPHLHIDTTRQSVQQSCSCWPSGKKPAGKDSPMHTASASALVGAVTQRD